jgi:hypothetical protein
VHDLADYGSSSLNWDFTLFSAADTPPSSSSLAFSASSAALPGSLFSTPDLSLNDTTDWNALSSASSVPALYLGNESQLLAHDPVSFMASDQQLGNMNMSTAFNDAHYSTPMVKGKTTLTSI